MLKGGTYIFKYRGKRIRASDKSLIYNTAISSFLILFLLAMLPFHLKSIMGIDWNTITLNDVTRQLQTGYFLGSVITDLFVCLIAGVLYYRYKIDDIKQLQHRQKLAQMILQNGWYEAEQVQSDGFFKTCQAPKQRSKSATFPRCIITSNMVSFTSMWKSQWENIKTSS